MGARSEGLAGRAAPSSVAVVGLGAMGSRIAARLMGAGREVAVWSRTAASAGPLADAGARIAASPAEAAASADAVIVMVSDPHAVAAVMESADGVASGVSGGTQVIIMSTVGGAAIAQASSALPAGTDLLDAPVLGSVTEAERGELRIFVGGSDSAARRADALLRVLGTPIHVGGLGAGSAAKLVANSALLGILAVLGESLALGETLGLSRPTAFDVLAATPLAEQAQRRRGALDTGTFPARFRLALARKDADLMLAEAAAAGGELRMMRSVRSWFVEAEERDRGEMDYTAVLATILDASAGGNPSAG